MSSPRFDAPRQQHLSPVTNQPWDLRTCLPESAMAFVAASTPPLLRKDRALNPGPHADNVRFDPGAQLDLGWLRWRPSHQWEPDFAPDFRRRGLDDLKELDFGDVATFAGERLELRGGSAADFFEVLQAWFSSSTGPVPSWRRMLTWMSDTVSAFAYRMSRRPMLLPVPTTSPSASRKTGSSTGRGRQRRARVLAPGGLEFAQRRLAHAPAQHVPRPNVSVGPLDFLPPIGRLMRGVPVIVSRRWSDWRGG